MKLERIIIRYLLALAVVLCGLGVEARAQPPALPEAGMNVPHATSNPIAAGGTTSATLSGEVIADPTPSDAEATLSDPVWTWSYTAVQVRDSSTASWADATSGSYSISISGDGGADSNASLSATLNAADYWKITCQGHVKWTDSDGNSYSCDTETEDLLVTAVSLSIDGTAVRQDDPTSTDYEDITGSMINSTLYGGSCADTSDKLKLIANLMPADAGIPLEWSVTGDSYASASGNTWNLLVKPHLGTVTFIVTATANSDITASLAMTVGIRSDDTIRVGWIDPGGVPLSSTGIEASVLACFPPGGPSAFPSAATPEVDVAYLGYLRLYPSSGSLTNPQTPGSWLTYISSYAIPVWMPGVPAVTYLTFADEQYIVDWLFKYASNPSPPSTFTDEAGIDSFEGDPTLYKLFNRLQIRYLADASGISFSFCHYSIKDAAIGTTIEPFFGAYVRGVAGNYNDVSVTKSDRAHLYNDGRPDSNLVAVLNTLMYPELWSDIGSRITLGIPFGTSPNMGQAAYPTYWNYADYSHTTTNSEAAAPSANFFIAPYPPNLAEAPWILP